MPSLVMLTGWMELSRESWKRKEWWAPDKTWLRKRRFGHLHPVQRRLRRHFYCCIPIWRWGLMRCHSRNFAMSHTGAQWGSPRGVSGIHLCEGNVPHGLALWKLDKHKGRFADYLISLWIHIMGIFGKQGKKHLSGITYVLGTHVQSEQEESIL